MTNTVKMEAHISNINSNGMKILKMTPKNLAIDSG